MKNFSEKIRHCRDAKNLTQEQLASLCNISRRSIASYESGEKEPHRSTLRKLSEALDVTEFYLTCDECSDPQAHLTEERFAHETEDLYGLNAAAEMTALLRQNEALFAGGTLSEDQKDLFYEALTRAYFLNKQHAREKFGRKDSDPQ